MLQFLSPFWRLQQKIEPSWRYLFELHSQAEHNTTNIQTAPDYSSATAIMLVILWIERNFWIISDCSNFFNNKLKNLWTRKNFFNPANTQSSSEESLKEKRHSFIGMCSLFTWLNMQILNLCHRWQRRIHHPLKYLKWSALQK